MRHILLSVILSFALNTPAYASSTSVRAESPTAVTAQVIANQYAEICVGNAAHGTFGARFIGDAGDKLVKLQLFTSSGQVYTYTLDADGSAATIPFSEGRGDYMVKVYVQIEGTTYRQVFITFLTAELADELEPFTQPNYYVNYRADGLAAEKARELTHGTESDAAKIEAVYSFVRGFSYDFEALAALKSGYVTDLDAAIEAKKGVCLDFAAAMTALLRCSGIPARLVFGYVGNAYHAWVEVYSDGEYTLSGGATLRKGWTRLDPTYARYEASPAVREYALNDTRYLPLYYS